MKTGALLRRAGALVGDAEQPTVVTRALAAALFAYIPLAVAVAVDRLAFHRVPPLARDFSVHTRCLVAIPLLVISEALLRRVIRTVSEGLAREQIVAPADQPRLELLLGRAARILRHPTTSAVLGALAAANAIRWWLRYADAAGPSVARWAYVIITLPISVYVALRVLLVWALWIATLFGLARLRLRPVDVHPDGAGGLQSLALPVGPFAVAVMALSSVVAGAWATHLLDGSMRLPQLAAPLGAMIIAALFVGLGPLAVFIPLLSRTRIDGLQRLDALGRAYASQFGARWLDDDERSRNDPSLLGIADIQSLADLHNGFDMVREMRPFAFTKREVIVIIGAVLIPMAPVIFTVMSFNELLGSVTRTLLGSIAHEEK